MARCRFALTAGFAIRGQVISALKNRAFTQDLTITVDEDKGFLESNYRVVVSGSNEEISAFSEWVKEFMRINV